MIHKTLHRKLKTEQYKPNTNKNKQKQPEYELGYSGTADSSCSTSDTRRVNVQRN